MTTSVTAAGITVTVNNGADPIQSWITAATEQGAIATLAGKPTEPRLVEGNGQLLALVRLELVLIQTDPSAAVHTIRARPPHPHERGWFRIIQEER